MFFLKGVTVARAGQPVLSCLDLEIHSGERILLTGENGAGKSSLLLLLAGRLYPYNNEGSRSYEWDQENFRTARRHIALVSRDEQLRLKQIHSQSTVMDFLIGHADGQDFLYREELPEDRAHAAQVIAAWRLGALAGRKIKTLSLGEMRLVQIARASMHERRLYLLDEIFSSLSEAASDRVKAWLTTLPESAAIVLTSHAMEIQSWFAANRRLHIEAGRLIEDRPVKEAASPGLQQAAAVPRGEQLIDCSRADFFHDFTPVLHAMEFQICASDRILLTGANGSGKTTLLRVLHGDFYPAYGTGPLRFSGALAHEQKSTLWQKVQLAAAAHFDYYPADMTVGDVLASRVSGSIYDYAETLPAAADEGLQAFALAEFLPRLFRNLSEGEKMRVLLARAFMLPAPVYLIDEGFMALSAQLFNRVLELLNGLPAEAVVVIAANERIGELRRGLAFALQHWQMQNGRLFRSGAPQATQP